MDSGVLIALVILLVVVLAVVAMLLARKRRSDHLQEQFGPEYERAVSRTGDRREAESELAARAQRRRELTVVPLEPDVRSRYQEEWLSTQGRFVDDPTGATRAADELVARVMRERGYPVDDDFEQQAAVVSVDHPEVVENYRAAHSISRANENGLATTDDLRQAFVHDRSLFAQLLDGDESKEVTR